MQQVEPAAKGGDVTDRVVTLDRPLNTKMTLEVDLLKADVDVIAACLRLRRGEVLSRTGEHGDSRQDEE
jgi:hypothetical protein